MPQGTVSSRLWSRSVGNAGSWCVQCMSTVVVSTCWRCGISKCFKCIGVHRHTYALCDYQCAQCLVEASGLGTEAASSVLADGVHQLRAAAREPSTFAHQATAMNHLRRCAAALDTQVLPMSVDLAPMVIAFFVQEGNFPQFWLGYAQLSLCGMLLVVCHRHLTSLQCSCSGMEPNG